MAGRYLTDSLSRSSDMFRRVDLPDRAPGRLYLHSMPGRYESWTDFVREGEWVKLDLVVSLVSDEEVQACSSAYFVARASGALPFPVKSLPIEDFGVPAEGEHPLFKDLARSVASELEAGRAILIHCRMGIGRTGLLATCVLVELGLEVGSAVRTVARAGSGAEARGQKDFIRWYADTYRHVD